MTYGPVGRLFGLGNKCPDCGHEFGDHIYRKDAEPACPTKPKAGAPSSGEDRKTFTIPPGYEAVRDGEGRATGEVRPCSADATRMLQLAEEIEDSYSGNFVEDILIHESDRRLIVTALNGFVGESGQKFEGDRVTILQDDFEGLLADRRELDRMRGAAQAVLEPSHLRAINELVAASEDEYCSDDTEEGEWREPDDEPVAAGIDRMSTITFGMVRRAREAIDALMDAQPPAAPVTKSAPGANGSRPHVESDPSVTLGLPGADTRCSAGTADPVAYRYDWRLKMFAYDDGGWHTTVGFKKPEGDQRNEYRNVVALYAAEPQTPSNRRGIYIASKVKHADRWRFMRDKVGEPIISTWIDEAGEGETSDHHDLWRRCITEASNCELLIVYREPEEVLKGAWVELGCALTNNVPVFAVGLDEYTIAKYRGIRHFKTMKEAMTESRSFLRASAHSRPEHLSPSASSPAEAAPSQRLPE